VTDIQTDGQTDDNRVIHAYSIAATRQKPLTKRNCIRKTTQDVQSNKLFLW